MNYEQQETLFTKEEQRQMLAELCKRSYYDFFLEFWETVSTEELVDNWHIKFICDELQSVAEDVFKRKPRKYDLAINVPPGTSKSTICTILFPAWLWIRDPSVKVLSSSYSSALSIPHAVKSRDVITSEKYKWLFGQIVLKDDANNKTEYENTKGGVRIATSVGGTSTGKHAHIIIIDDPLNPKQAVSDVERESANQHVSTTLSSRKISKKVSVTILVMQRLHEKDPTGEYLEKKAGRVRHICLPAELGDNVSPIEARDMYINGLLDPQRMDLEVLEEQKVELGSYGYSGQFAQNPSPSDGAIWQRWFVSVPDADFPAHLSDLSTDWDTAFTENEMNAASAYVTSGMLAGKMYIDALGWVYEEFPQLIKTMASIAAPHYIEDKASGSSARQTMVDMSIPAIRVKVPGGADKIARARTATPYAEAGLIYVRASLLDKLYNDKEQGILRFPRAAKKDLADALAQAIIRRFCMKKPGMKTNYYSRPYE